MRPLPPLLIASALLMALLAALPARARPLPAPLHGTLPLGTVLTVTLTLENPSAQPQPLHLYAARAPAPAPTPPDARPAPAALLDPALRRAFAHAPGAAQPMLIVLDARPTLSTAAALPDWAARGEAVVAALRASAAQSQAPLLAALRDQGYEGESFWAANVVAVRGDAALAHWLEAQPAVARIELDARQPLPDSATAPSDVGAPGLTWGLRAIGARSVWSRWGVRGEGIVVANIDSGVEGSHPALREQYRGWQAGTLSHAYHWADFAQRPPAPAPTDAGSHGTHTMGTMVGRASEGDVAFGVAPGARWMAVRACSAFFCNESDLLRAAQWLLAPTDPAGRNPRPDLRPHIVNNSWSTSGSEAWYSQILAAWEAAGLFALFSAGNMGPACGSIQMPASSPLAFSVGASTGAGAIPPFSGRGPTFDGRIAPDLVAPGRGIYSSVPGGYDFKDGTSMAAPHVAGTVALLWSANPALIGDVASTRALLRATTQPIPLDECSGLGGNPNNAAGFGQVDAARAVQQAPLLLPWLSVPPTVTIPAGGTLALPVTLDARRVAAAGDYAARLLVAREGLWESIPVTMRVEPLAGSVSLSGTLHDRWSGAGLWGEVVVAGGPRIPTDGRGAFRATLPPGSHSLRAEALGYQPISQTLTLTDDVRLPLTLTAHLPHLHMPPFAPPDLALAFGERLSVALTLRNEGLEPLRVEATVPADSWTVRPLAAEALLETHHLLPLELSGDEVAGPLALPFPITVAGRRYERLWVSANGWASVEPTGAGAARAWCLPMGFLPSRTLAPFWSDLEPRAGQVRAGLSEEGHFVVAWDKVALAGGEPEQRYSFQLLFNRAGPIDFRYGAMGPLPPQWAVGVNDDGWAGESLGCHEAPRTLAGQAWRWQSQPPASAWLAVAPPTLQLPPGHEGRIVLSLGGAVAAPWHSGPLEAAALLHTNDPAQPNVALPVRLTIAPPPHTLWLPLASAPH